jgi:hypothetical protein
MAELSPGEPAAGVLNDELLEAVPFGRNRFFRYLGTGLFGAATAFILRNAPPAEAHHNGVPYPCYGYGRCHYCDGRICYRYCRDVSYAGCHSGGQCWNTCTAFGLYRCCDWIEQFPNVGPHYCICSQRMQNLC